MPAGARQRRGRERGRQHNFLQYYSLPPLLLLRFSRPVLGALLWAIHHIYVLPRHFPLLSCGSSPSRIRLSAPCRPPGHCPPELEIRKPGNSISHAHCLPAAAVRLPSAAVQSGSPSDGRKLVTAALPARLSVPASRPCVHRLRRGYLHRRHRDAAALYGAVKAPVTINKCL